VQNGENGENGGNGDCRLFRLACSHREGHSGLRQAPDPSAVVTAKIDDILSPQDEPDRFGAVAPLTARNLETVASSAVVEREHLVCH
jgi:hypothetical protein